MVVTESEYSLQQYLEAGQVLIEERNFAEAIELYELAIQAYPEAASLYQALGFVQERSHQLEEAKANYRQAIDRDPQVPAWVYIALGRLLGQQEQWDESLLLYQSGIAYHTKQGDLYRELGLAQDRLGYRTEALLNYQKAVELKPEQPLWVYTTLGALLTQKQDWHTLIQVYTQAIKVHPNHAEFHRELGFVQKQSGDILEEIESYSRAINLSTQPVWVYTTLIDLLTQRQENTQAIKVCNQGIAAYPNDEALIQRLEDLAQTGTDVADEGLSLDWYWQRAIALSQQEQYSAAIEIYQEAIELYPDRAELYRELGIIQEKIQDFAGEIKSYHKAIELEVQPTWVYSTLAELLCQRGDSIEAIAIYQKAAEQYPQNTSLLSRLKQLKQQEIEDKNDIKKEALPETVVSLDDKLRLLLREISSHYQSNHTNSTSGIKQRDDSGQELTFDWMFYVTYHNDLSYLSSREEAYEHWFNYGRHEGRAASIKDFYQKLGVDESELPVDFNYIEYAEINSDLEGYQKNKYALIAHYLKHGRYEGRVYSAKQLYFSSSRTSSSQASISPKQLLSNSVERRIAILIHIDYGQSLSQFEQYIINFYEFPHDVFISIHEEVWNPLIHSQLHSKIPDCKIIIITGKTRSLTGQLASMGQMQWAQYDILCFLQPQQQDESRVLPELNSLEQLFGSPDRIKSNLSILRDNTSIGAIGCSHDDSKHLELKNDDYSKVWEKAVTSSMTDQCAFSRGSIFMVKTKMLYPIYQSLSSSGLTQEGESSILISQHEELEPFFQNLIVSTICSQHLQIDWQE
ncbi:MAG: tetratricopeptide repeat protein [Elainella sp. Prado103]|nr:tetratricopeptide repeat protein [Elainella sp. Prado103]